MLAIPAKGSDRRTVTCLDPRRGQSAPGQSRLTHLGRTARPRAPTHHRAERPARLRTDRPDMRRPATRQRTSPAGVRQRQERKSRSPHQPDRRRAQGLDPRARWPANGPTVPDPHRRGPNARRHRKASRQAPRNRPPPSPDTGPKSTVSIHTLRHPATMMLLNAGVDTRLPPA